MQETKNLKEYIPLNFTFESQISSKYFFAITFFDDNNTNFSKWRKQSNFFCAVMHFARLYRLSSSIQLLIQIQISVFELKFIFIFCVRWNIYISLANFGRQLVVVTLYVLVVLMSDRRTLSISTNDFTLFDMFQYDNFYFNVRFFFSLFSFYLGVWNEHTLESWTTWDWESNKNHWQTKKRKMKNSRRKKKGKKQVVNNTAQKPDDHFILACWRWAVELQSNFKSECKCVWVWQRQLLSMCDSFVPTRVSAILFSILNVFTCINNNYN